MKGPVEFIHDTLAEDKGLPSYGELLRVSDADELEKMGKIHLMHAALGSGLTAIGIAVHNGISIKIENENHPQVARAADTVLEVAFRAPLFGATLLAGALAVEGATKFVRIRKMLRGINTVE